VTRRYGENGSEPNSYLHGAIANAKEQPSSGAAESIAIIAFTQLSSSVPDKELNDTFAEDISTSLDENAAGEQRVRLMTKCRGIHL